MSCTYITRAQNLTKMYEITDSLLDEAISISGILIGMLGFFISLRSLWIVLMLINLLLGFIFIFFFYRFFNF